MSVTRAPRARMAVNASWPGVSRNTMRRPLCSASLAPTCWVMPPRSPAATALLRIASRRLVLPWSTWPMTVTMGARETRFAGSSSSPMMTSLASSPSGASPDASMVDSVGLGSATS